MHARKVAMATAATVAAVLCGCGAPPQAAPGHDFDESRAVAAITTYLQSRQITGGGQREPCSRFFSVTNVRIVDKRVTPDVVLVDALFDVTAVRDLMNDSLATASCFGSGQGRFWNAGQTYSSKKKLRFERWESGWNLTGEPVPGVSSL